MFVMVTNASIMMAEVANPGVMMATAGQEADISTEGVKEASELIMKNVDRGQEGRLHLCFCKHYLKNLQITDNLLN